MDDVETMVVERVEKLTEENVMCVAVQVADVLQHIDPLTPAVVQTLERVLVAKMEGMDVFVELWEHAKAAEENGSPPEAEDFVVEGGGGGGGGNVMEEIDESEVVSDEAQYVKKVFRKRKVNRVAFRPTMRFLAMAMISTSSVERKRAEAWEILDNLRVRENESLDVFEARVRAYKRILPKMKGFPNLKKVTAKAKEAIRAHHAAHPDHPTTQ